MSLNAIILSDIYGFSSETDVDDYYLQKTAQFLQSIGYSTTIFSLLQLANLSIKNGKEVDTAFVTEIIERSVVNLTDKKLNCDLCIGFSAGGIVLWKMITEDKLKTDKLVCISSTRLRQFTEVAPCPTLAIFAQEDKFAPTQEKLESLKCYYKIVPHSNHDFYRYETFGATLSENIAFFRPV